MWFCTNEGVSRFDGNGFTNFTVADGLPSRHVNDFLETKDGTIYLATNQGLVRLNPRGIRNSPENPLFTTFQTADPKAEEFDVLFENTAGQVFCGTGNGLYKFNHGNFEKVELRRPISDSNVLAITSVTENRDGSLWVGTSPDGLFRIAGAGGIEHYTTANGLADNEITTLFSDRDGTMWVGMRAATKGGLCQIDTTNDPARVGKCYFSVDGLASDWVTAIARTSDNDLWVATTRGLCHWNGEGAGSVCKTYTAKNGLCDTDVWSILQDRDGNLWTGSSCGVKKISRLGFTGFSAVDGLGDGNINSIFENYSGQLFVTVTTDKGRIISRFDNEEFSPANPRLSPEIGYFGWGWGQTVWQDRDGSWLIPTGDGLFRSPPNTDFSRIREAAFQRVQVKTKDKEIFRVFEDLHGNLWLSTTGAVNQLLIWDRAENVWHDYSIEAGLSSSIVATAFAEDRNGDLWIGTGDARGTLIRYRDGLFKIFAHPDGPALGWLRDLFFDRNGNLWIASTESGLVRVEDLGAEKLSLVRYTSADGLSSMGTSCVAQDELGRIYVGTGRGLDRLNPATGQIENFTTFDGLPNGNVEICYEDHHGSLWFGAGKGLARFNPEAEKSRRPPTVLITGLRINGEAQGVSVLGESEIPSIELGSDERQVMVDFIGLGATLGEKLRYEYRINQSDWTATNQRTINFANLTSGAYLLQIRAITADRILSQSPASVSFRIATPIWQRWWFLLSAVAIIVLLFFLFYRNRLNKLLEIERTRTRIATDLHDDIGSNLSKISLLSDIVNMQIVNGSTESKRMLTTIADVSRSSVASMRDIVWAIDPSRDSVLEMTRKMREHAEDVLVPKNISVRFEAPESGTETRLSMDVRRELFLIFKEAVNNTAKHSNCSHVNIDFRVSGHEIILEIDDDGHGFDPTEQTSGNGLANIRRRTEKLRGRVDIRSAPNEGTCITLTISQRAHANT